MTFEEALKAMREGKKVRRASWDIPTIFYSYANGVGIYDSFKNEEDMIYTKDILAEDWEIVDEST